MNKKKNLIFKFFDKYCVGDLVPEVGNDNWLQLSVDIDSLGYSIDDRVLYYNGNIADQVMSIFSVSQGEFREYFRDWFVDKHKLKVVVVI